jgi:plastocyanin
MPVLRVAAAIALTLTLGGCSMWGMEGGPGGAGAADPTVSSGQSAVPATPGADGVQRITITMGDDLRLHPSVVLAHPGTIEFTFHNTGAIPHDIEFSASAASTAGPTGGTGNLNAGTSATVRVSVSAPGDYPFPCIYHQSSGMVGTLMVR